MLCCVLSQVRFLPQGNLLPPSLYLMKKVIGVREPVDYEHHVCRNDCMVFTDLARDQWPQHAADKCDKCGAQRFEAVGPKGVLRPVKVRRGGGGGVVSARALHAHRLRPHARSCPLLTGVLVLWAGRAPPEHDAGP